MRPEIIVKAAPPWLVDRAKIFHVAEQLYLGRSWHVHEAKLDVSLDLLHVT